MGEAKRRREAEAARSATLLPAIERVGRALRKLATAASANLGSDCYLHAALGRELLADFGFDARIAAGEVAWRVGAGDGDVIAHTPRANSSFTASSIPPGKLALAYHAWLVVDHQVVDFTTYQLERKARELDAADGGHTTVEWKPDVLVLPVRLVMSYRQVRMSPKPGVAFYDAHPELLSQMAATYELDPDDVAAARLIMSNPDMRVFGPNDIRANDE